MTTSRNRYSSATLAVFTVMTTYNPMASADDCYIDDRQVEQTSMSSEVTGVCANNGKPIRCSYHIDQGWTCSGPHGEYTSMGVDTGELISEACGCGVE